MYSSKNWQKDPIIDGKQWIKNEILQKNEVFFLLAASNWWCNKYYSIECLFQVIHQKPKKTLDEISHDLCPVSGFNMLLDVHHLF